LHALSTQTGVAVISASDDLQGLASAAISGEFTPLDAALQMLAGTGLEVQQSDSGALIIVPNNDAPSPDAGNNNDVDSRLIQDLTVVAEQRADQARGISLGFFGERDTFDTPYSIQQFESNDMLRMNIDSLGDLQRIDPTISTAFDSYNVDISTRGFSLTNESVRLDGAPTGFGVNIPFEFLERTEILKGANGFLYGFASPAGTLNSVTKRPADKFEASLGLRLTEDENVRVYGDVSNRFAGDKVGIRIQGLVEDGTEQSRDIDREVVAAQVSAEWLATERLLVEADYMRQDSDAFGGYGEPLYGGTNHEIPVPDPATILDNDFKADWEVIAFELESVGVSAIYALSDTWTLQFRGRHSETHQPLSEGTFIFPASAETFNAFVYSLGNTQDFTLYQGILSGAFQTGSLYHEVSVVVDRQIAKFAEATNISFAPGGFDLPWSEGLQLPDPGVDDVGPIVDAREETQDGIVIADAISWDAWTVIAAVRAISYEKEEFLSGLPDVDEDEVLPSLGVLYSLNEKVSLYGSIAKNLERGTGTGVITANPNQQLPPVESEQVEVGAKIALSEELIMTLALFDISRDYEYINEDNFYVSDGVQNHRGVELIFTGAVNDRLTLYGGGYLIDAQVEDLSNQPDAVPANIPELQFSLRANYALSEVLHVNGGVFHSSEKEVDVPNQRTIDAYTTVDVGASYDIAFRHFNLTLVGGVQNLLDEEYWQSPISVGSPRTVTFQLLANY